MAQALEAEPRHRDDPRPRHRRARRSRSSGPSSSGPTRRTRSSTASSGPPRSTPSSTPSSSSTPPRCPARALHEINVIGTLNLLAAAGAAGSSVRHVVVKSSTLVYGSAEKDPAWFREDTPRSTPRRTRVERSLIEVESLVRDFTEDNPHVVVTAPPLRQRARHRHRHPDQPRTCPGPLLPVHRRLRPAAPVRRGGRRRPGPRVRHPPPAPRACSTWPAHGRLPWSEVASICGDTLLPLPPVHPASRRRPARPARRRPVPARDGRPRSATAAASTPAA